ncbi:MAG TPA: Asp-tRNA(Asn)/Glu-tRNA(Gln) amidotransferase subunit GatC [Candidatus Paceibacterota bacterium]
MEINTSYLANLARIHSDRVSEGLKSSIASILEFVDKLAGAEVKSFKNTNYNRTRPDNVENFAFSRELLLKNFPQQQDGFLVVPQILKK